MRPDVVALGLITIVVLGAIAFALFAVRRIRMDPQEFIVGGRSFGALLLWILLAGEIYTAFTFLGAAGWAYGKGAPAFYIMSYGTIGYTIAYFYLPKIWLIGKNAALMTWPDLLIDRYGSKTLGIAVALLQFFLTVPYVALQLSGLSTILTIAGYGQINSTVAVAIAFLLMAGFVFTAGLRGAAWASVIKDVLVLGGALFAGIYLPIHFFGSPGAMFARVAAAHPHWLSLAPGSAPLGVNWYISTVLLTGVGFFMGPANAQSIFSARDENAVRRNMMLMPLYQLVIVFVLLAGFAALLVTPGLTKGAVDQSFLLLLQHYFPAWLLGIIGAAGCLAALLPASVLMLGAASILSRNVIGHTRYVRALVLVCAILALVMWLFYNATLVELLLLYYNGITQLAPAVILAVASRRPNAWAIGAGLAAGELTAGFAMRHDIGIFGLNPGLVALAINVAVLIAIWLAFPRSKRSVQANGSKLASSI